jgi:hypothetical protein
MGQKVVGSFILQFHIRPTLCQSNRIIQDGKEVEWVQII